MKSKKKQKTSRHYKKWMALIALLIILLSIIDIAIFALVAAGFNKIFLVPAVLFFYLIVGAFQAADRIADEENKRIENANPWYYDKGSSSNK